MQLEQILESLPDVEIAVGYGSGVKKQIGYGRGEIAAIALNQDATMVASTPPRLVTIACDAVAMLLWHSRPGCADG